MPHRPMPAAMYHSHCIAAASIAVATALPFSRNNSPEFEDSGMRGRYVHMVEPRVNESMGGATARDAKDSLAPFRAIWPNTFISAGGHDQARVSCSFLCNRSLGAIVRKTGRAVVRGPHTTTRVVPPGWHAHWAGGND